MIEYNDLLSSMKIFSRSNELTPKFLQGEPGDCGKVGAGIFYMIAYLVLRYDTI